MHLLNRNGRFGPGLEVLADHKLGDALDLDSVVYCRCARDGIQIGVSSGGSADSDDTSEVVLVVVVSVDRGGSDRRQ